MLRIRVCKAEDALGRSFAEGGGTLASAVARADVDFSLTGSEFSTDVFLTDSTTTIELDLTNLKTIDYDPNTLETDDFTKMQDFFQLYLNITVSRMGCAIDATPSLSLASQGSVSLRELILNKRRQSPTLVPVFYPNWSKAHATIVVSNIEYVPPLSPSFEQPGLELLLNKYFDKTSTITPFACDKESVAGGLEQKIYNTSWSIVEKHPFLASPI